VLKRLCLLGWALSLCSCYSITLQSASEKAIMFSGQKTLPRQDYRVVRHFYHLHEIHFVFGIPMAEETERLLSKVLETELTPSQTVINLRVRRYVSPLNQLNTFLTLGLYLRAQLIIEGDIIEQN
jgi:hypothetical protein